MSHARDFGLESGNAEAARQLIYDYRKAELSASDRALCEFAEKLTKTPGNMSADDVNLLREAQFTDEQISVATQVVSYFNYINRIADGLGVDPEDWMTPSREQWNRDRS